MEERVCGINVTIIDNKHIYIGWSAVDGATYYEIERQIAGSDDWKVLEMGGWVAMGGTPDQLTDTHFLDEDVDQNTNYQYRVRVFIQGNALYATATQEGVTFVADNLGIIGNSISLVFNGIDTVDTVVNAWNTANPTNTVSHDGAGTEILASATVNLAGGIDLDPNTEGYSAWSLTGIVGVAVQTKIGYTFENYIVPTGKWGVVGTPDDLRYDYLFGIDLNAENGQIYPDSALKKNIDESTEDFERYLGIVIKRRKIVTQPQVYFPNYQRERYWSDSPEKYTHEDDPYEFSADDWRDGFGQLKLRYFPIISIARAKLYTETDAELYDFIHAEWLRPDKKSGIISFFPKVGVEALGPFTQGALYMRTQYKRGYPHGYKFDYDAGYETSDFVPNDLRGVIMKWSAIKSLASIGDGLLAGFSSSSISLDGLSESFSSTQSATSAYFGARIKQYQDEIKDWLKQNRYKFSNIPMGFVG
jgi:hypothetical protein